MSTDADVSLNSRFMFQHVEHKGKLYQLKIHISNENKIIRLYKGPNYNRPISQKFS